MLRGTFELIGDKSISHRSIMFSAISKGDVYKRQLYNNSRAYNRAV